MITEMRDGFRVIRFHTLHRHHEESVGHHSANVCAILLRLHPDCSRNLLVRALMHDVPEAYTGDVPYPFKADHPDIKKALFEGEYDFIEEYNIPDPHITGFEKDLLKLADMLDLVLSGLEELGRGNMYAKQYVQRGQDYIEAMPIYEDYKLKVNLMVAEVKDQWQQTTSK